ncbi:MAG: methylmalonyl Co-A mutase-associated GTPase MeaB [Planctomycetota bacterium]|nr:methylmalonyl Co-A mutase-associated GTPase MeaB [Planctomycetota bacterium]
MDTDSLAERILKGDKRGLARAISLVESGSPKALPLLNAIYPKVGSACRLGLTGPPGVGKSTLVTEISLLLREKGNKVGIIAIDPTSPFTGGALLGDRIRMQRIGLDEGIFIRSMATRGMLGGIARATFQAADLLDAAGKNYVIIETVGVGQSEVEISRAVDTTILVLSPESGDAVQAMKAGVMEIADIVVINKADRPGANRLEDEIRAVLALGVKKGCEPPPIIKTEATTGAGLKELVETIEKRQADVEKLHGRDAIRHRLLAMQLKTLVESRLHELLWSSKPIEALIKQLIVDVEARKTSPYAIVDEIVAAFRAEEH